MPLPLLQYGLRDAVPDHATAAWGARAIITQDGYIDLVHDRIDVVGPRVILAQLDTEFSLPELCDTLRDLLASGLMHTRTREPIVLYQSATLVVVADTLGSSGYCYLAAWTTQHPPSPSSPDPAEHT